MPGYGFSSPGQFNPSGGAIYTQQMPGFYPGDATHTYVMQHPGVGENLGFAQQAQNFQQGQQKFDMFKNLFGSLTQGLGGGQGGQGQQSVNLGTGMNYTGYNNPFNLPAPNYVPQSPVYSQQQVNAMSNLQRSNLQQQAAGQSKQFADSLGARGFSPLSPLGGFNYQNNMMKANAAAAQNETQLNFNAAQANSDARLKAAGINAGMWGDWVRNLMGSQEAMNQFTLGQENVGLRGQELRNQLLMSLMGNLRT